MSVTKVKKRNEKIVKFELSYIERAIKLAMTSAGEFLTQDKLTPILDDIINRLNQTNDDVVDIETIQNTVEMCLYEHGAFKTAKSYILYRNQRDKERSNGDIEYGLLSKDFLSKYKHTANPMSPLGAFVYSRTYSRYLQNIGRREHWWETCRRAVEYNCSLVPGTTKEEAQQLYDNMFNLRQFVSGRTMWVGNTEVSKKYPMANFNCAFEVIDNYHAYHDLFYLLMVGAGVGVRVLKDDAAKLPKIRTDVTLIHETYVETPKSDRLEFTEVTYGGQIATIKIGDSKEGWAQAIERYFDVMTNLEYRDIDMIIVNYNSIRPKGERLKIFGGTASGYESMMKMIDKIHNTIKNAGVRDHSDRVQLHPLDLLDIANIIGENVVSGGVRRTAEIGLIDQDDQETINAKSNLYHQVNGVWEIDKSIAHRQMSNNSIYYRRKPTREELHDHLMKMRYSGEPGWVNEVAASKRRDNFNGCNPCFAGDMKILTPYGYKKIESLVGEDVELIDNTGTVVHGRVWCTGEKPTVSIHLDSDKFDIIECTDNHRFMLSDDTECEAKNLAGKKIKTFSGDDVIVSLVEHTGKTKKVYDFSIPTTHWGVVEGVIAHNCGEILLDSHGLCNLTTVNVMAFVNENTYCLDKESLINAMKLSARAGYRMTCRELEIHEWNKIQDRDRLIGCSMTGWQDMVNMVELTRDQEIELLEKLRDAVHTEAYAYADKLHMPRPALCTTIKPEGTISLLPTVSAGVHYSHSPYYIRRVRITATDPLCKVCEDLGYPVLPEVGQTAENCVTKVVEFPVQAPEGKTKYDVSAIEQLENYKMMMDHYIDHNCSITVHVRDNEWDDVEDWVWNHWDDTVALSFLSLDDNFYELMPYEAISKEEYDRRVSVMKPFNPALISKYEHEETELDFGDSECVNGVCPVR